MLLEHFKISWISFNEEKNYIANKRFYSIEKSIKIAKKFSLLIADKIWNKKLILFFGEKRYLQIYLYDYLKKNTYRYFLYISLIKKKRIKDEKIFLWFENSFFSKITIKDEKGFFNLKPRFLEGLNLIPFVFKILTFISSKLLRIFVIKRKKQKNKKNSIKELKTIVFPVGGLFKKSKTYFFDLTWIFLKEKKGQLNKKDFLFCELEENIKISKESKNFYKKIASNFFYLEKD